MRVAVKNRDVSHGVRFLHRLEQTTALGVYGFDGNTFKSFCWEHVWIAEEGCSKTNEALHNVQGSKTDFYWIMNDRTFAQQEKKYYFELRLYT